MLTDRESAILHNLLAKYCAEFASPGEWSVTERRAFTDLAADLRDSSYEPGLKWEEFPDII